MDGWKNIWPNLNKDNDTRVVDMYEIVELAKQTGLNVYDLKKMLQETAKNNCIGELKALEDQEEHKHI